MSNKHEREPWVLGGCSGRMVTTPSGYVGDGFIADVDTKDNARRIVACVNACRGLPTEELEQKGLVAAVGTQLLDLDESLTQARAHASAYKDRSAKEASRAHDLEKLRDELLAALAAVIEWFDMEADHSIEPDFMKRVDACGKSEDMARAAIAKAKVGAA